MQLNSTMTINKTGQPTKSAIEKAKKLTKRLIEAQDKKVIAAELGAQLPNVYRWELVPGKYLPAFVAKFGDGATMDQLRPDYFHCKG